MTVLVTGAAGLIGVNLVRRLLASGERVVGLDNLCRGVRSNLQTVEANPAFEFEQVDLDDLSAYRSALARVHHATPVTEVWHLAANSDIPAGVSDPAVDLRDTFMTTYNTLVLMAEFGIRRLAFASSSAVYGDLGDRALTEDAGPLFPISNYGAMKLASEAAISAATESGLEQVWIFRFPNVVGVPATHGVILDFVRKLQQSPACLEVLGNGTQQKSYLHVDELVDAMLFIRHKTDARLNYFNVGTDDRGVTVRSIAERVVAQVSPSAGIKYGSADRGWVGDVPKFHYSIAKLEQLGWRPRFSSAEAVALAVEQIARQEDRT
jgi:UDP-glucose 4-epimerase